MCARRNLAREHTENRAEYLERLARSRPHLTSQCRALSEYFACARYGGMTSADDARRALAASRVIAQLIDDAPEGIT